nr:Kinesin domain containing protein [Haemonchus contortus]
MGTGKGGDNVVVAVRVRPFNDREKGRKAQLIIEMPDGQRTCIRDPNNSSDEKWFTFDHSYWSHDGFKTEKNGYFSPEDSRYADQKRVFEDLGKGILENAWAGYNCSLFAYGQTGSGKSYSIVGFKGNKGIVPTFCEELFKDIEAKKENTKKAGSYEVFISMFEIYCEKSPHYREVTIRAEVIENQWWNNNKEIRNQSRGSGWKIPYRDSVLTCLLKNALGGNSKTIMIAAISPADINYDETLSTLRFADRAKAIKTNAIVNENQTERLLRELREENERLQKQLKGGGGGTNEEIESLRRQLEQNQKEMSELEKTWQEKVAEEAAKVN